LIDEKIQKQKLKKNHESKKGHQSKMIIIDWCTHDQKKGRRQKKNHESKKGHQSKMIYYLIQKLEGAQFDMLPSLFSFLYLLN